MIHIFVVIAFVYLAIKFFNRALVMTWGFSRIAATLFFLLAIPSFFLFVIIDSVVFLLLPLVFMLTAIDLVSVPAEAKNNC